MDNNNTHIALIDWCHLIEDFLDNLGMSLDDFCGKLTGGWMVGYMDALKIAGAKVTFFCFSLRVGSVKHLVHRPTGSVVCVLPAPGIYRRLRRRLLNPYVTEVEQAVGELSAAGRLWWTFALHAAPYLATPLRALAREIRREGCTTILCQEYEHARFDLCVLLGLAMRLPVFATFQGGDWQLSPWERFIRPLSFRKSAGLVVATATEARRLRRSYKRLPPVARIFNPIDLDIWKGSSREEARRSLGIPAGALVVAWHGRVDYHRKGLDVLLDAWEHVRRERPQQDLRLLLIGTGNNAEELRGRLSRNPIPGLLWVDEFINDRNRIKIYLKSADIYAFPSRHEGFPVAPIEAMACGLPLVAADAQGIPDILEGGEAAGGLVVPRGDVLSFSRALARLIDDPELTEKLGRLARRRAESVFSLNAVGMQLRQFLNHV